MEYLRGIDMNTHAIKENKASLAANVLVKAAAEQKRTYEAIAYMRKKITVNRLFNARRPDHSGEKKSIQSTIKQAINLIQALDARFKSEEVAREAAITCVRYMTSKKIQSAEILDDVTGALAALLDEKSVSRIYPEGGSVSEKWMANACKALRQPEIMEPVIGIGSISVKNAAITAIFAALAKDGPELAFEFAQRIWPVSRFEKLRKGFAQSKGEDLGTKELEMFEARLYEIAREIASGAKKH